VAYVVGQSPGRDVRDNRKRNKTWEMSVTHFNNQEKRNAERIDKDCAKRDTRTKARLVNH
jgi:hypothetical protein